MDSSSFLVLLSKPALERYSLPFIITLGVLLPHHPSLFSLIAENAGEQRPLSNFTFCEWVKVKYNSFISFDLITHAILYHLIHSGRIRINPNRSKTRKQSLHRCSIFRGLCYFFYQWMLCWQQDDTRYREEDKVNLVLFQNSEKYELPCWSSVEDCSKINHISHQALPC